MKLIALSVNEDDENVQISNEKMFRILKYFLLLLMFLLYFSPLSQIKFLAYTEHSNEFQAHGFTQQLMRSWHCWLT